MWKLLILMLGLTFSTTLNAETKILTFAGSLRTDSLNKKLAAAVAHIAKEIGADATYIDLKDYPIPFYDADLEADTGMPDNVKKIRRMMIDSEVILIASPNYNSSLSALLKNTLDWTSRSEENSSSREAFKGKKFVVMTASAGSHGGVKGLAHLRAVIEHIGGIVISQEIIVPNANAAFDEKGKIVNPKLHTDLKDLIQGLIDSTS